MPTASPHAAASARNPVRRALAALGTVGLTALAACGSVTASTQPGPVTHVAVAVVPITDAAPFILAVQRGYFTRAGLDVTYTLTPQSVAATADLLHGSVNVIAAANYVSFFAGQAHGALNIRVLAANSQCGTNTQAVLALPGSGITKPADLAGKTIAVNVSPNIQTLTINRQLNADGVNAATVHYVVIPFASMASALKAGRVAAISEVEPFLTQAEAGLGAQPVLEQCTGPTAGIPLGGYLTTAAWATAHPAAARAFQRAIEEGQALAATDRAAVEKVLPAYMHISKGTAALVNLNTFPTSADPVVLQRVANLMKEGGMLTKPLNVAPLVIK
ncbi:MAG: ABC transporter substrate-binding protein [Streptosporangiaceae bacterium]|jgi:NitT/TauT family transport system substrate-binding protein